MHEIKWLESGMKYSHSTYHESEEEAYKTIEEHWENEERKNIIGSEYFIPCEPVKIS